MNRSCVATAKNGHQVSSALEAHHGVLSLCSKLSRLLRPAVSQACNTSSTLSNKGLRYQQIRHAIYKQASKSDLLQVGHMKFNGYLVSCVANKHARSPSKYWDGSSSHNMQVLKLLTCTARPWSVTDTLARGLRNRQNNKCCVTKANVGSKFKLVSVCFAHEVYCVRPCLTMHHGCFANAAEQQLRNKNITAKRTSITHTSFRLGTHTTTQRHLRPRHAAPACWPWQPDAR